MEGNYLIYPKLGPFTSWRVGLAPSMMCLRHETAGPPIQSRSHRSRVRSQSCHPPQSGAVEDWRSADPDMVADPTSPHSYPKDIEYNAKEKEKKKENIEKIIEKKGYRNTMKDRERKKD